MNKTQNIDNNPGKPKAKRITYSKRKYIYSGAGKDLTKKFEPLADGVLIFECDPPEKIPDGALIYR